MDDHGDPNELFGQVLDHLIKTYGLVGKALKDLPLPIEIPAYAGTGYQQEVHDGLIRAYRVLDEMPVGEALRESVKGMALDWLTACDYLWDAHEDAEIEFWKLDFVVTQLYRVKSRWDVIQGMKDALE